MIYFYDFYFSNSFVLYPSDFKNLIALSNLCGKIADNPPDGEIIAIISPFFKEGGFISFIKKNKGFTINN